MVEPGGDRPRGAAGNAGMFLEDEQVADRHGRTPILAHVQAKNVSVESERTLEISDPKADTADVGVRGKCGHATWWGPAALCATLFAR